MLKLTSATKGYDLSHPFCVYFQLYIHVIIEDEIFSILKINWRYMMNSDEENFSNFSRKDKIIAISTIPILIFLACAFIFFVYVGIFRLIGVEYSSRTALLLFLY